MSYKLEKSIRKLLSKGKICEAYKALTEIVSDDENYNRFLNIKKSSLAAQCGYYFLADFFLILAKENLPKNSQYYEIVTIESNLALATKDYDRTVSCCKEALAANYTKNGSVYLTLGHAQIELEQYEEAMKNYKKAAKISTDTAIRRASNFSLAALSFSLGNFKLAETAIKICIAEEDILTEKSVNLLVNILFKQRRYKDANRFLRIAKRCNQKIKYDEGIDIILAKKLRSELPHPTSDKYHISQLIDYKRSKALKHIKKHHQYKSGKSGVFASNIDIEELFDEVKMQMTEATMTNEDILDTYDIDYPNAGFDTDNNPVNKIKVVAVPETKNIITMYPSGKRTIKASTKEIQKKISSL